MAKFKYFESQQDDEEIILLVRKHIIHLFPVFFLCFIFYVLVFSGIFLLPSFMPSVVEGLAYNIYVLSLSLIFIFTTTFLFNAWVLHYLTVTLLTTEHFVDIQQTSLFSRKISQLSLDKIQDASALQAGLTHTLLNLGTVEIQTAGEADNFTISFVPDPNAIAQKVMEVEEEYCKRYGLRSDGVNTNANNVNNNTQKAAEQPEQVVGSEPTIEFPGQDNN